MSRIGQVFNWSGRSALLTSDADLTLPGSAKNSPGRQRKRTLTDFGLALAVIGASTTVAYFLQYYATGTDLAMIQVLGIIIVGLRHDVRIALTASFFAIAVFDFMFVPPQMRFAWSDAKRFVTFFGMMVVAVVVSTLNRRTLQQERQARKTAAYTLALSRFQTQIAGCSQVHQLTATARQAIEQLLEAEVLVMLASEDGALQKPDLGGAAEHLDTAQAVWVRKQITSTRVGGKHFFWVPLIGIGAPLGVIGIGSVVAISEGSELCLLVIAFCNQLAMAIERTRLTAAVQRSRVEAATERMRNTLLSAVSHDLKTPLATIVAAGTTLLGRSATLGAVESRELLAAMVSQAERLGRLIQNILYMSRLESPTIELRKAPEAIEEIIASACDRWRKDCEHMQLRVDISCDLPWVHIEAGLIEHVLLNLFENVARHAGPRTNLSVVARSTGQFVMIQVADDGPGFVDSDLDRVFEKFYRGRRINKSDGGAGLGLAICRAIIDAHGGQICAKNGSSGGGLIEFTLPVAELMAHEAQGNYA